MAKYYINANVDYVMGHLRYGHYEGTIDEKDLPDGITIEDLMEDPSLIKDYDLTDFLEFVIFVLVLMFAFAVSLIGAKFIYFEVLTVGASDTFLPFTSTT